MDTSDVVRLLQAIDVLDVEAPGPWPPPPEQEDAWAIDWAASRQGPQQVDAAGPSGWLAVLDRLTTMIGDDASTPGRLLDADAWYLPIHFYGPQWGIFVRESAVLRTAVSILVRLPEKRRTDLVVVAGAVRAALTRLFLHEAFHHKTESYAIRLESIERVRRYAPYSDQVYRNVNLTDECLEEALACADMLRRADEAPYARWVPPDVLDAADAMTRQWILTLPGGYRRGVEFAEQDAYGTALRRLSSQIHEAAVTPARDDAEWDLFPLRFHSLFTCLTVTYILVPVGTRPVVPWFSHEPRLLAISSRDVGRIVVKHFGGQLLPKAGKGSHLRYRLPSGSTLTVPANREALTPGVLATVTRTLGLTSPHRLRDYR